ncbi:hypothetical protein GPK34_00975 [Secundilactobacillus kimchicus]|uniref:hypothetical protein n=1 Tax=Secundilactobacillus kimchicus TaxID=528209 RepID=UPI001C037D6E|nr:hypothetical protein [Secundilactobacillus kimchicus]MBT9670610.1 hypothetical protein [Secundilactobacillus kimchicus]
MDNKLEKETNGSTGAVFFSLLLSIGFMFLNGLYFKLAWGWIMVPLFGINPISYWAGLALLMFLRVFIVRAAVDYNVSGWQLLTRTISSELSISILTFVLWLLSLSI